MSQLCVSSDVVTLYPKKFIRKSSDSYAMVRAPRSRSK